VSVVTTAAHGTRADDVMHVGVVCGHSIAGTSWEVNDRIAANACIEALSALMQGCQPRAVAFAARALGRSGWNGAWRRRCHRPPRVSSLALAPNSYLSVLVT
jgi:hypothetical protein